MTQLPTEGEQAPPLTRKVKISEIEPEVEKTIAVNAAEREAIKHLLDLVALDRLDLTYRMRMGAKGRVHLSGRLTAHAVQTCVVSLEPVPAMLEVPVEVEFWPAGLLADLEKKADDPQQAGLVDWPEAIEADQVDLGPLVYETLATSLEPYPRKTGASFQWSDDRVVLPENGPFAGLKRLKDR